MRAFGIGLAACLVCVTPALAQQAAQPPQQLTPSEFALSVQQNLTAVGSGITSLAQAAESFRKQVIELQAQLRVANDKAVALQKQIDDLKNTPAASSPVKGK